VRTSSSRPWVGVSLFMTVSSRVSSSLTPQSLAFIYLFDNFSPRLRMTCHACLPWGLVDGDPIQGSGAGGAFPTLSC
jgi:hypothetical protein